MRRGYIATVSHARSSSRFPLPASSSHWFKVQSRAPAPQPGMVARAGRTSSAFRVPDAVEPGLGAEIQAVAVDRRCGEGHLAQAVLRDLIVAIGGVQHERVAILAEQVDAAL